MRFWGAATGPLQGLASQDGHETIISTRKFVGQMLVQQRVHGLPSHVPRPLGEYHSIYHVFIQ
jgi:hypothetical protein